MSTPQQGPASNSSTEATFLDKIKFLQEHIKLILTLATGSLVLSVSLLQNLGKTFRGKEFLHRSWLWLLASILAGVACNYILTVYLNSKKNDFRILIAVISFLLHVFFIAAMIYFLRFALANL